MVRSILLASVVALCYGLVPSRPTVSRTVSLKMSESSTALVPVNDENIKASAAATAGATGLVLGGPVLAVVTSVLGNYGSRQESEVGEVVRGVGKVSLEVYNFLLRLNGKYDLSDKAKQALGFAGDLSIKAIDKGLELNKEYKITDQVKDKVAEAVEKAKKSKSA